MKRLEVKNLVFEGKEKKFIELGRDEAHKQFFYESSGASQKNRFQVKKKKIEMHHTKLNKTSFDN